LDFDVLTYIIIVVWSREGFFVQNNKY